ncbi:MAG: Crp/Fnr family transcriptional regulator [Bacteroidota bacterium]|nr:Crp/Fnr family transcriptional regulator [Bacteroidota bacterium]
MAQFPESGSCTTCAYRPVLFKTCSEKEIERINRTRSEVSFKAGEILFKQGMPASYFFCLTSGLVKLYIEGTTKNLTLELVKPFEYILCPGLFLDKRRHFSAAAMEDSTACLLDENELRHIIRENPDFAEEFIRLLSRQTVFQSERLINLTQKHMQGRMADVLLYLYHHIYCRNPFEMNLSRQDLADFSGMTKESSIRILKEFKENGVLFVDGNKFHILNFDMLKQISDTGKNR